MENYELLPGKLLQAEYEEHQFFGAISNSQEYRDAIVMMVGEISKMLEELPSEMTIRCKTQMRSSSSKIKEWSNWVYAFKNGEESFYPPYIFRKGYQIDYMSFDIPISFEQKERYSMFLALELRRSNLYRIMNWLDYLRNEHGKTVFKFLQMHLMEYEFMYDRKRLKAFESWFEWQTELESTEKIDESSSDGISIHSVTNAQKVLAVHFFMEYYNGCIKKDGGVNKSDLTRFVEMILNKPSSKISNSSYYKMLKKAPSIHDTPQANIEDMEVVEMLMTKFGLAKVNRLLKGAVDKEIEFRKSY